MFALISDVERMYLFHMYVFLYFAPVVPGDILLYHFYGRVRGREMSFHLSRKPIKHTPHIFYCPLLLALCHRTYLIFQFVLSRSTLQAASNTNGTPKVSYSHFLRILNNIRIYDYQIMSQGHAKSYLNFVCAHLNLKSMNFDFNMEKNETYIFHNFDLNHAFMLSEFLRYQKHEMISKDFIKFPYLERFTNIEKYLKGFLVISRNCKTF